MVICIIIAGIIAILSIFAFFGNVFSNTGGTIIPNMFQLMFGGSGTYSGITVQWKQFGGLTFLFILQIVIIVISIGAFIIAYFMHAKKISNLIGMIVSIVLASLSTAAFIISFCTLALTNLTGTTVQLGFGPIFYSILHILVILILISGILIKKFGFFRFIKQYSFSNSSTLNDSVLTQNQANELSEKEKIEILMKYKKMLDDNIINQEEFEKKKKEIL